MNLSILLALSLVFLIAGRRIVRFGVTPSALMVILYAFYGLIYLIISTFQISKSNLELWSISRIGFPIYFTANALAEFQVNNFSFLWMYTFIMAAILFVTFSASHRSIEKLYRFKFGNPKEGKSHQSRLFFSLIIVAIFYLVIILAHMLSIDWGRLAYFRDYQEFKHPAGLGLDQAWQRFLHFLLKQGGFLFFALGIGCLRRHRFIASVIILESMYPFAFNLITNSRLVVLFPLVAVLFSLDRRKIGSALAYAAIAISLLMHVIIMRNAPEMGYEIFNFSALFITFNNLDVAIVGLSVNFFDPLLQWSAIAHRSNDWDGMYKILSFSPLPSSIDGFSNVAGNELRLSTAAPYSAWAEAFYFGWGYFLVLLILFSTFLFVVDRLYRFVGRYGRTAIVSWVLLVNQLIVQYPIRNSFRFLLFSILICFLIEIVLRKRYRPPER